MVSTTLHLGIEFGMPCGTHCWVNIALGKGLCCVRQENIIWSPLLWCYNGRDGVSNRQSDDCLLNRLFRRRSKNKSKLRVTGLCAGNSSVTGELPAQMASNAQNVSIWWRHHASLPKSMPYDANRLYWVTICTWRWQKYDQLIYSNRISNHLTNLYVKICKVLYITYIFQYQ